MSERLVPSGWKDGFISTIASVNPSVSLAGLNADSIVSFLSMADVGENGRVINPQRRPLGEVRSGFTRFQEDDVLFAKITPCMENGKGALARNLENGIGFGSTEFHVLRANESGHADFIYHLSLFAETREKAASFFSGSAGQQRVSTDFFSKNPVLVPPKPEQRKIARILTTLDNLIEKTEALIAKYQAIKQGMMHDLFTRGVDSSGQLRPTQQQALDLYKQSELGWIPKEWDERTFGSLASYVNGHSFDSALWKKSGLPIIRIQNLNGELDFNFYDGPVDSKWEVLPGDLLFAWSGMLETSFGPRLWHGSRGVLNQHIFKVIPNERLTSKEFLNRLLKFHLDEIAKSAHGFKSSFVHVTRTQVTDVAVGLPKLGEQVEITNRMDRVDGVIRREQDSVAKYRKTKSGLMQDLLTGKVRVKVDETEEAGKG